MARKKGRVKDRWREKKWVTVRTPDSFGNEPVAYIPITDEGSLGGRVVETTLYDILKGDASQHQYKLYFKIVAVDGEEARTIFRGYEYAKEFLRSLVRRGSSKVNFITDVATKDGHTFRIKVIVLTQHQLNSSKKHALRLVVRDIVGKKIPEMTIDQFVQATCYNAINSEIMAGVKRIVRVRHVGLEKVKLIKTAEEQITLLKA